MAVSESGTGPARFLWHYIPSLAATIIFLVLFTTATFYHSWKIHTTKAKFCIAFVIGGAFEILGYGNRLAAHYFRGSLILYSLQSVFLLLGPTLFAASIYMALGRIIRSVHAEKYALVHVNWITKVFIAGDILSFVIQGAASGVIVSSDNPKIGSNMVVAGLLIQVVMFCFFVATAMVFEARMKRCPTVEPAFGHLEWKSHIRVLYAVSLFILIRSVFRVIEYSQGYDGYALTHEWTLYVFDSTLMFAVMFVWGFCHPGAL